ncbi:MAG: rhomboid family intramembrane serine protease [Bacteroidota bacterium]
MKNQQFQTSTIAEALLWPSLLIIVLWLFYWAEHLFLFPFHELGVQPGTSKGLVGIVGMPLIHAQNDIRHIVNNSIPVFILSATLIHFYKPIALRVFLILWITTGLLVWAFAATNGHYHIGISGVIYGLASFLFTSGVLRKFLPLQAISLFVVFMYGSMIWGLFPMQERISWEGHLAGFLAGIVLAFVYRKEGTQRPKFQYEIEKEMGIEPPDLEGIYHEQLRQEEELQRWKERMANGHVIVYHYVPDSTKEDGKNQ